MSAVGPVSHHPPRERLARARGAAGSAWSWFGAWRRTRPFWGGLWLIGGGAVVIHFTRSPLGIALSGGWSGSAGYVIGGAMAAFGAAAWFAPLYKSMTGLMGVGLALAAFVSANLGGFLLGSVLGIVGGSMVWGWGPKPARSGRRQRTQKHADAGTSAL